MQSKDPLQGKRKADEMFLLLEEQALSGLSVKEFCHSNRLSTAVYYYWQKKFKQESAEEASVAGFKELSIKPGNGSFLGQVFAEYKGVIFYQEPSVSFLKQLMG